MHARSYNNIPSNKNNVESTRSKGNSEALANTLARASHQGPRAVATLLASILSVVSSGEEVELEVRENNIRDVRDSNIADNCSSAETHD